MAIATINPTTGETLKTFTSLTDGELNDRLELAQKAFTKYRYTTGEQRAQWLLKVGDILEENKSEYGKVITLEMGKTLKSAIAEVEKCAVVCRFYAENASKFLADRPIPTDSPHSFVRYDPLGIILAVMPWNFPFWQVFRFAAPALMAGNVGLLKHASNVPQCALLIAEIFRQGGFPEGVFQSLLIGSEKVAQIMADLRVKAATLTGSEPAGESLASIAGKHLKKTVLELGGSDPFIVMSSADLTQAISAGVTARLLNNGQSCIAAKRFILQEEIADQFIQGFVEKFQDLKVGDPMLPEMDIGPLATRQILEEIENQVQSCVKAGAKILIGGQRLSERPGYFYLPTILTDFPPNCMAYSEEFFGPVALIFRVKGIDEAIELANSTNFGLGASAWTDVSEEKNRFINELEAGAVFINGLVKSDPRLPFGGIKRSGYGRELSQEGLHEFVNIKTVWIQ